MNFIDVTHQRFGRLIVVGDADRAASGRRRVRCDCDCGNSSVVDPRLLRNGQTTSCGCRQKEAVSKVRSASKQFEKPVNQMPEYNSWLGMKKRCFNQKEPKYPNYGGRGINVCSRWVDSFPNFYADMGDRPTPGHSIDRINVNGDYEPDNCRWATAVEQAQNKRYHVWVKYEGERMPLSRACQLSGVNYRSAISRHHNNHDWQPLPDPPK